MFRLDCPGFRGVYPLSSRIHLRHQEDKTFFGVRTVIVVVVVDVVVIVVVFVKFVAEVVIVDPGVVA